MIESQSFNRKQETTIFAATSRNSELNHLKKLQIVLQFTTIMLTKIKQLKRSKYILKICFHSNRTMQPKDKITLTNFIGPLTLKLLENKSKLKVAGVTCSKSKTETLEQCVKYVQS